MVTKTDLAGLRDYQEDTGRVLSIYLDVDQSKEANLNRGFESVINGELRQLSGRFEEESERQAFESSARRAQDFLTKYVPGARGLVLYSRSAGSFWARELSVPIRTEVRWGEGAYLQPLLEAMDEYQRYGVVLLDRMRARIYTVLLGRVEKYAEIFATGDVRRIKSAGSDHLYSQSHIQRKADEHAHSQMRRVAEVLGDLSEFTPFDRLVLAGTTEATSEMFRVLPKWLQARVVGSVPMSINATETEMLSITEKMEFDAERGFESDRVDKLLNASGKGQKATVNCGETLRAINERRVREFVYAGGHMIPGARCRQCGAVFVSADALCIYCEVPLVPLDDVVEAAAVRALAAGAGIEQLRGEAAERLCAVGGVGAFLRY